MSDTKSLTPEESRLVPALKLVATILREQTAVLADIGRHLENLDKTVVDALERLKKAESRVAGLELDRDAEDLPGNGHA